MKKDLLNFGQLSSPPAILTKGLALALSSLGVFKGAGINFRKGAYSYKGDFQSLKDKLPKIVVGVLILILLLGFNVFSRFHVINDRQNRMDTVLADFTKEMF